MSDVITPVTEKLNQVQGRLRRLFFLDGMARVALVLGAFAVITFVLDFLLVLPPEVRVVALIAGFLWAGWTVWEKIIYPLRVRIHNDDLALLLEQEYPDLNDRLISAVQLSRKEAREYGEQLSPQLVSLLLDDAVAASRGLAFERIVVRKNVAAFMGWTFCFLAVLAVLSFRFPEYSSVYFKRVIGMKTRWPQVIYLKVLSFPEDHNKVVAKGDDLEITVQVERGSPKEVWIHYQFKHAEKGKIEMRRQADGTFKGVFERILGPFTFDVRGGDAVTDVYEVSTLTPPAVERLRYWYAFPKYTGKAGTPRETPEVSGNIVAPVYTQVELEITSNEDVESGSLIIGTVRKGEEKKIPLSKVNDVSNLPRILKGSFEVKDDFQDYRILIKATNRLDNSRGIIRYTIKPIIDQPPHLKVLDPVTDEDVTENARRPLSVLTTDDYGVAEVKLVYRVVAAGDGEEQEKKFGADENTPPEYGGMSLRSLYEFDISKLKVKPGDYIVYRYVASDYKDIGGKNVNKSPDLRFRVISQTAMEQALETLINEIKKGLEAQKRDQENLHRRTEEAEQKFGRLDVLTPEQRSEVKSLALKQNSITHGLDRHRKGVEKVLKMGTYNRIFDEAASRKLENVLDLLQGVVGQESRPGKSGKAGEWLQAATNVRNAKERSKALKDTGQVQDDIVMDIGKALELLEEWSNYQEVVRRIRELHRDVKDQNEQIKKSFGEPEQKDQKKEEKKE